MPSTTQTSDFWGWYLRHNNRVVWKHLSDAGIDVFASGPNNNTQAFLDLTNILPSVNEGFSRRWGIQSVNASTPGIASSGSNIMRTFLYNVPQDQASPSTTANQNLIIGTDGYSFYTYNDSFTTYTGYGPSNFTRSYSVVTAGLTTAGTGYPVSLTNVNVATTTSGGGLGAVLSISTNGSGHVTAGTLISGGLGYFIGDFLYPVSGFGTGASFTVSAVTNPLGNVGAVTSREFFYYGNGIEAPRKVQPINTATNTDSLNGIAIPCSAPGSTTISSYPNVVIPASTSTGGAHSGVVGMLSAGSGYLPGNAYATTGGSGTGMVITVDSVYTNPSIPASGIIGSFHVAVWGSSYVFGDIVSLSTGGPPGIGATFKVVQLPAGVAGSAAGGTGLGYAASTSFNVNCLDALGSGSGGVIACFTDANGAIVFASVVTGGTNYQQAYAVIPTPSSGGVQGYVVVYTQTNASAGSSGEVVGVDLAGPMSFVQGRQYAVALQNSKTGHTSDVPTSITTQIPYGPTSGGVFNTISSVYDKLINPTLATLPTYVASQNQTAGFTQINTTITIPSLGLDPQVDTVLLLATSDGGSLGTLYQVNTFPLSTFTLSGGFYTLQYYDNLPDSYNTANNTYAVVNTLLASDLWAYTDPLGDTFGILLNTPPTSQGFKYPVLHQGRMFSTDGRTVFFSKSLDEVTTNTGLITSKWEECWPGDYQLPIALNNETILGLISDGTNLHVGTDKSIFTIYGSDPSNFSVPSTAFAQTGILSNDCWSVIYAEGIPSGFVWITQDYKIIHSDFTTYREIGTAIYPILAAFNTAKLANAKVSSLTQGPYNFVVLSFWRFFSSNPQPELWIWETRLQKWYHWVLPSLETIPATGSAGIGSFFVYQYPSFTGSSFIPGSKYLMYWRWINTGTNELILRYFNPAQTALEDIVDSTVPIPWSVQTSWQDCGDSTAIKVVNEVEFTSDEALPLTVTLLGATSQAQFDSGGVTLKTGSSSTAPLSALAVNKFYCAGAPTAAKYYSLKFAPITASTAPSVLTSFSLEYYPMSRI
jgi:hypothetical protein